MLYAVFCEAANNVLSSFPYSSTVMKHLALLSLVLVLGACSDSTPDIEAPVPTISNASVLAVKDDAQVEIYQAVLNRTYPVASIKPIRLEEAQIERVEGHTFLTLRGKGKDGQCVTVAMERADDGSALAGKTTTVGNSCVGDNCARCSMLYLPTGEFDRCRCDIPDGVGANFIVLLSFFV